MGTFKDTPHHEPPIARHRKQYLLRETAISEIFLLKKAALPIGILSSSS